MTEEEKTKKTSRRAETVLTDPPAEKTEIDTSAWQALFDQLASQGGDGSVYYLKENKTRLRLVLPDEDSDPYNFYAETTKIYNGKTSAAYMVWAIVMQTSKDGDQNVDPKRVRAVRIARTVLQGIVGQLAEGFELFHPTEGHGVTIEKTTQGQRTAYIVKASPKPIAVRADLEWPDRDLETLAQEEADKQEKREQERKSGHGNNGRRNQPQEMESDEDLPF